MPVTDRGMMPARNSSSGLVRLILAFSFGVAIAHLATSASPFVVGSLIEGYGFSATKAGLVAFSQIGALALSMIIFAPVASWFRPLPVCLCGSAVACCSNALIYQAPASLVLLFVLGTVVGIGYGLILSAAVSAAATTSHPDRIYAAGTSGTLLLIVPMLSALPAANRQFGARGTFLAIALLILVCAPFLFGFHGSKDAFRPRNAHSPTLVRAPALLAVWSLLSFGTGAMWAFTERIGLARGLPSTAVGWVLSISPFVGLLGTALAPAAARFSRLHTLAIAFIGSGSACLLFTLCGSIWTFALAALAYWVCTMFAYVLLLGTAARLDPTGRLGTLGTGCERFAFAISAPLGGMLVDFVSLTAMGIVATAACSVVALLFFPALRHTLHTASITPAFDRGG